MDNNHLITEAQIMENISRNMTESLQHKNKYAILLERAQKVREDMKKPYDDVFESMLINAYMAVENKLNSLVGKQRIEKYFQEGAGATDPSDIDFVNYAFPMVTALLATSPIEEFGTIYNSGRRWAEVPFYESRKSVSKGAYHTADDLYNSAQTGPNTGKNFSSQKVDDEELYTGDGSTLVFNTATVQWFPIITPATDFEITLKFTIGGTEYTAIGVDNGDGTFTLSHTYIDSTNTSIILSTGVNTITFNNAPDAGTTLDLTYYHDNDVPTKSKQSRVYFKLVSTLIRTVRYELTGEYMFDSFPIIEKEQGIDISKYFIDDLVSGVQNEIAIEAADKVYTSANANSGIATTFKYTQTTQYVTLMQYRAGLLQTFSDMDINIREGLNNKVNSNFAIVGSRAMKIIQGLPKDYYEPINYGGNDPVGMYVAGTFGNKWRIISNFEGFTEKKFVIGYKGNNWLKTGLAHVEFLPIMITDVNWNKPSDMWRTLVTWRANKIVNNSFFHKGEISD